MSELRVLFFDIETAPLLAHIWRPTDQYVPHDRIVHDSFMLCWGAKWRGGTNVKTMVLSEAEAIEQEDSRLVSGLADLIREADVVVAHNANGFDLPMLNNRLLLLGLDPLGPTRVIDTLTLARRNFRLPYNKLDYLAQALGLGSKLKTGFDLWLRAYHGDAKALEKMRRYNRQDVILLELVFEKLRPYVKNMPRLFEADSPDDPLCPWCGDREFIYRGYYRTQASTFRQRQCKTCGRYTRSRTSERNRLADQPL